MKTIEKKKNSKYIKIVIFSFALFLLSQLVVNSVLTPLGSSLESLNTEKEHLLEENRVISENIAKNSSLRVIESLSEKNLHLSQNRVQTFVYIEDSSLVAHN